MSGTNCYFIKKKTLTPLKTNGINHAESGMYSKNRGLKTPALSNKNTLPAVT